MTESEFQIETTAVGPGEALLAVRGDVDLYTAPELKSELMRLVGEGVRRVVVDFSATTYIDSTTLGVLLGALKRLRPLEGGGDLVIVSADPNILRILEVTLLDRVFTTYDTVAEALAAPLAPSAERPPVR